MKRYLAYAAAATLWMQAPAALARQSAVPDLPDPAGVADFMDALVTAQKGRLTIHAVQGSKDAPAVGSADIEVHLFHREKAIRRIDLKLDEQGATVVDDLPVGIGLTPVVRIKYAGVVYQELGPEMSPQKPDASMNVAVYETTDVRPEWTITMRHVMAAPSPDCVSVSETLVVNNPADRTWLGGAPSAEGRRTTVSVGLPRGTRNVRLEDGFHGWCCTTFTDDTLAVQMPLMPGKAVYRYSYEVAPASGAADLSFSSPVVAHSMVLFVPDDGTTTEPAGLMQTGVSKMGDVPMRVFQGQELTSGQGVGIVLAGLRAPVINAGRGTPDVAKIVAAVGVGVAAVIGAGVLIVRSRRAAAPRLKGVSA